MAHFGWGKHLGKFTQMRILGYSIALVALAVLPRSGAAQDTIPSLIQRTGTLRSRRVTESSGVAVSRRFDGILWTHNDSGDKPVIYAINAAGDLLRIYQVPGAEAVDWEDIALAPCPGETTPCLYIADTGDNGETRKTAAIYIVPEPDYSAGGADTSSTAPARGVTIRYPDGSHDVEAIFVAPSGNVSLISKGRTHGVLHFVVPRDSLKRDTTKAILLETLPITPQRTMGRLVTGAAISPSRKRVVVRTYSELFFFALDSREFLRPEGKPCWLGAAEPQGEAVDFLDEDTLVLTSEALPDQNGTIYRVRCPI
jgi:hypothetical protein